MIIRDVSFGIEKTNPCLKGAGRRVMNSLFSFAAWKQGGMKLTKQDPEMPTPDPSFRAIHTMDLTAAEVYATCSLERAWCESPFGLFSCEATPCWGWPRRTAGSSWRRSRSQWRRCTWRTPWRWLRTTPWRWPRRWNCWPFMVYCMQPSRIFIPAGRLGS